MVKSIVILRRAATVVAGAALLASSAGAATNGSFAATSTGSISITASVANRAQITGLNDVTFTTLDPTVAAQNAQSNCVWTNTLNHSYSITATGSGGSTNAFTLSNGTVTVPYSVTWAATTGQTTGTALTSGTALPSQTSAAANPTCSTGAATTSSLIIGITAPNVLGMVAGTTYTGTLSLLVTPQ